MARDLDALTECPDCGLIQRLPRASDGALMTCQRCNAVLVQVRRFSIRISLACALIGLSLLALGMMRPAASLTIQGGRFVEIDIFEGVQLLKQRGTWELALAVALTLVIMPALKLLAIAVMSICAMRGRAPRWVKTFYAYMHEMRDWAMVDVFLLGAMIALVRIRAWGYVWFGPALFALAGVALCTLAIDALLDSRSFWRRVGKNEGRDSGPDSDARGSIPLIGCLHCGAVVYRRSGQRCPRCEQTIHLRKTNSLTRTWAFVIASATLLIPANVLPVMSVTKMGRGGPDTILSGTIELSEHGLWGLAAIVFTASIVIPVLKLVSLAVLLETTRRGTTTRLQRRTKIYRVVAIIGRWSMIDIFATMTLVAIGQFGWLGTVRPGTGAIAFCAVVFLTMIASESFDPRLMWDAAGENGARLSPRPVQRPAPVPAANRQALS